jgi:hypothetical protein
MVLKANALMAGMYTPPTPMPINALPRDAQPMPGAIPIFLIFIVQSKNSDTIISSQRKSWSKWIKGSRKN